jgi:VWFA-related protein
LHAPTGFGIPVWRAWRRGCRGTNAAGELSRRRSRGPRRLRRRRCHGAFVPDLTADDVAVEEDGRAQTISAFSLVNIPVEETAPTSGVTRDTAVGSDVDGQGRLFVLALDDVRLHPVRLSTAKAIARQFVERHLGPRDRAAFITISGKTGTGQFTSDHASLITQIGRTRSRDQDFYSMAPAVRSFRYLESIVDRLAVIEGRRKSLILITEGIYADVKFVPQVSPPRPVIADDGPDDAVEEMLLASRPAEFDFTGTLTSDAIAARALVEAAARANVAIYPIDPRGQPGGPWDSIRAGILARDETPGWDNFAFAQDVMSALAAETGGSAVTNSNDCTGAFNRRGD